LNLKSILSGILASMVASSAAMAGDAKGVWLSQDGNAKVRVTDCGGALCGTLVWLREPIDPKTHRPRTDQLNPDISKRDRPMLGLQVAQGLRPTGVDRWSGLIYNADKGKSYQVTLTIKNPNQATLVGCILAVICKSERWTRI
jgi:uncharacterized protein (DUF2147 family)